LRNRQLVVNNPLKIDSLGSNPSSAANFMLRFLKTNNGSLILQESYTGPINVAGVSIGATKWKDIKIVTEVEAFKEEQDFYDTCLNSVMSQKAKAEREALRDKDYSGSGIVVDRSKNKFEPSFTKEDEF
jgi:hypothetical protein